MTEYLGAIFDLDGVLVDTAKYHFLAWKKLADQLDVPFTEENNECLKGVSRIKSLDILLSLGNKSSSEDERNKFMEQKNKEYVRYISQMDEREILPGVIELLNQLKDRKLKIALGSASKNSGLILKNTKLQDYFDVIVDGNDVSKAKPDPEVFLLGAKRIGIPASQCIVFEDAYAGIEAAKKAGMLAIGVGNRKSLPHADVLVETLENLDLSVLKSKKDGDIK